MGVQGRQLGRAQRLSPFSILGIELNMLAALSGVYVGRVVVALREILLRTVTSSAALLSRFLLPVFIRSVTNRTACNITATVMRTTSILIVHFAGCIMLAPCVARGLIHLVERAQIEQH